MKTTFQTLTALILVLFVMTGCEVLDKVFSKESSIADAVAHAESQDHDPDKTFVLEGYFWNESTPVLIEDLTLLESNGPLPRGAYISLSGPGIDQMLKDESFVGAQIRISGTVASLQWPGTKTSYTVLRCPDLPKLLSRRRPEIQLPFTGNICDRFPILCGPVSIPQLNNRFALLYSGGINPTDAHRRYWNDLAFMYATLRNTYGYRPENIVVVYKDGMPADSSMPVHFAANPVGLDDAIQFLTARCSTNSDLLVFVTNHGGGQHRCDGHQNVRGNRCQTGLLDGNGDEGNPPDVADECFYYYLNPFGDNEVRDDDFAAALAQIPCRQRITIMEPCHSGGFLQDLRGPRNVSVSACLSDELSYGRLRVNGVNFDDFAYYFIEAMNQADPAGNAPIRNPDTNGDGRISVLEAFLYAVALDTANETPLLDGNGDGIGESNPSALSPDGSAVRDVFF